jgi:hypothetical protein
MARWEQYEIWTEKDTKKWEILGVFPVVELASAMASGRSGRVRIIQTTYDDSKLISQEIIADLGHFTPEQTS